MSTPEGKVKAQVKKLLGAYDGMYQYWPVPSGFGDTSLDCIICYRGRFATIETKAKGKKPTPRQMNTIYQIEYAMGKSFIISGEDSPVLEELRLWLNKLVLVPHDPHFTSDPVNRTPI